MNDIPKVWDTYIHHSGREYVIQCITNVEGLHSKKSVKSIKFPPTVVYTGIDSGKFYSRPLIEFLDKFTLKMENK